MQTSVLALWCKVARNDKCEAGMQRARKYVTAVGFEPTPLRTGALSQRLRPLGQTVLRNWTYIRLSFVDGSLRDERRRLIYRKYIRLP